MPYKVVIQYGGDLLSYSVVGDLETKYKPNEWAKAHPKLAERGYHPVVFDALKHAIDFLKSPSMSPAVQIWACEIEEQITPLPPKAESPYEIVRLGHTHYNQPWPEGTVMAKRVKLTQRIY